MFMDVTAVIGQLGFLEFVFSFLLVFGLLYALFSKTKVPSDKPDLNALIAFVIAFLVAISPGFSKFLMAYVPYAAVILVLVALGFMVFAFFGAKPEQALKTSSFVYSIVILLVVGAFAILGMMWPSAQSNSNASTGAGNTSLNDMCSNYSNLSGLPAVQCLLGDPLFLGVIVVFVIMAIAVYLLVISPKK